MGRRFLHVGSEVVSDALAFLAGGGEAARMIRERDWSGHPLRAARDVAGGVPHGAQPRIELA